MEKPTYIDLFSGCGGLSLGLQNAGWKGLFAIEKSPDAFKTLKYNLIEKTHHFDWPTWLPQEANDINLVLKSYKKEFCELRGHVDMVAGGPPCQGFSMAGRRDEFDLRNNLVNSYIQFIRLVKPKIIFFENVKGFTLEFKKNRDKGVTYSEYVKKKLSNSGYQVYGELVNFADYGVPQKRTRFILVGVRRDIVGKNRKIAKNFFDQIKANRNSFLHSKKITITTNLEDAISDLFTSNGMIKSLDSKKFSAGVYSKPRSEYQKLMRANVNQLSPDSHRFVNHKKVNIDKFRAILTSAKRGVSIDNEIREFYQIKKHTIIPLAGNEKSPTITTLPDDYIHYVEPRILTVREYARIQTFPDDFEFKGKYTTGGKMRIQEVPRYSQIGNAIPPLFAEQSGIILRKLF